MCRYKNEAGADEDTELRRSSIHLLLSMLCLPLQFGSTPIQGMYKGVGAVFLGSLKRLVSGVGPTVLVGKESQRVCY